MMTVGLTQEDPFAIDFPSLIENGVVDFHMLFLFQSLNCHLLQRTGSLPSSHQAVKQLFPALLGWMKLSKACCF